MKRVALAVVFLLIAVAPSVVLLSISEFETPLQFFMLLLVGVALPSLFFMLVILFLMLWEELVWLLRLH